MLPNTLFIAFLHILTAMLRNPQHCTHLCYEHCTNENWVTGAVHTRSTLKIDTHPANQVIYFPSNRMFISIITKACHWMLSWASSTKSTPTMQTPEFQVLMNHISFFFAVYVVANNMSKSKVPYCQILYDEVLGPRPIPKMDDHSLWAASGCPYL
jgi:hypothetical protein